MNKFLFFSILYTSSLFSMLSFDPKIYHGQEITPHNLIELSKPGLAAKDEEKVLTFFYNNPEVTTCVVKQTPRITDFKKQHTYNKELLEKAGAKLLTSSNNYIFQIPGLDTHVLKHTGLTSPFFNIMVGLKGYRRTAELLQSGLAEFHQLRDVYPTYQTASEAATALRIQEFIENNPPCGIIPIPTHLIALPGCPPDTSDQNSVVVKKFIDLKPLSTVENKMEYLTPERIKQLIKLIKWADLWEVSSSNSCIDQAGNLYLPDGEQPDNSNLLDFYHKNHKKILWNSGCGIESLYNMLPENSEARALVRNKVIGDVDYKQSDYYPHLLEAFTQNP